jgi:hypothetical protein
MHSMSFARNGVFLILMIALVGVAVEAPIGYFLGLYNWTEYYSESRKIGGGETQDGYPLQLETGDSLRLEIDFDQSPLVASMLLLIPANAWPCMPDCTKVQVAAALQVAPDLGRTIELLYTATTGGAFVWFGAGISGPLTGFVSGTATLRLSRLYLVILPFIMIGVLFVFIDHRKARQSRITTARTRRCPRCGNELRERLRFCTKCGAKQL